jgi:plastocyanin
MSRSLRSKLAASLALASVLALAVCGDEGGEPTPPSNDLGTIAGTVRDQGGAGISGVTVTLSGGASRTATTSSSGAYSFGNLEPGSYTVAVTVPEGYSLASGQSGSRSVTVSAGQSATVDFELAREGVGSVVVVELQGTSFIPSQVTIQRGQTVRWVNRDGQFHTVTPDGHGEWSSASLNQSGQTFEHTFDDAGNFDYFCQPHRTAGMTGRVVVQ